MKPDQDWKTGAGKHWKLSTCIWRVADGWMWRVRYNATTWKGGPLTSKQAAVAAVRARFDHIIAIQALTNPGT